MSGLHAEVSAGIMDESGPAAGLEPSALLFTHIPALFYVLHLLYEDLKLDELQRSGARALVGLLQQMARYNNLAIAVNIEYSILLRTIRVVIELKWWGE